MGVDHTGVIVAHALTDATVDDATTGVELIEAVSDDITRVTADAAYDTVAFYDAAGARGATVVVPPAKTARVSRRRPLARARESHDHQGEAHRTATVEEDVGEFKGSMQRCDDHTKEGSCNVCVLYVCRRRKPQRSGSAGGGAGAVPPYPWSPRPATMSDNLQTTTYSG